MLGCTMVQPSERLLTTKLAGCSMEHPYMSKCIFTLCVNYNLKFFRANYPVRAFLRLISS